jgi:2,5-diketo-D-gluconate reductase A
MDVPRVSLSGGAQMPVLGLGTWPMDDAEADAAVGEAFARGYRLVDTAYGYRNERGVGRAVRASGVPRSEAFVTTKLNGEWHGDCEAGEALGDSLDRLGMDYVDLYLIHWPMPWRDRYVDAWRGLLRLRADGLARAVGVSNFKPAHLDRLLAETGEAPEVNQIQLDPTVARAESRAFHSAHGIITQSWGPLGHGRELLRHPVIGRIADRHGRTPAQVILRWHLDLGLTAVPKTSSPERMAANLDVFDFRLPAEDLAELAALDRGEAAATDSDATGH